VKSGDADPVSPARQSLIPGFGSFTETRRLSRGSDGAGNGSVGRSMVVGSRAAAGTPCREQTPVIWRSGEVESERGHTVEASASFIGAGAGTSLAWRGAVRAGPSAGACSGDARARQTRGHFFLPVF
jgi:hypothetical protein